MSMVIDPVTGEVTEPTTEPDTAPDETEPEPDTEPDTEPEPDTEREPDEPDSLTLTQGLAKRLDSENKRHERALEKIYGDSWESLAPCPLCLADGFVIPAPPGAMSPDQWEAIELAAGHISERRLNKAPYTKRCETCGGWGALDTDSLTDHGREVPCADCDGKGWVANVSVPPPAPQFAQPTGQPNGSYPWDANPNGPMDQWDRPAGHPNFGVPPAQVTGY